jgi:hypothetical protein
LMLLQRRLGANPGRLTRGKSRRRRGINLVDQLADTSESAAKRISFIERLISLRSAMLSWSRAIFNAVVILSLIVAGDLAVPPSRTNSLTRSSNGGQALESPLVGLRGFDRLLRHGVLSRGSNSSLKPKSNPQEFHEYDGSAANNDLRSQ